MSRLKASIAAAFAIGVLAAAATPAAAQTKMRISYQVPTVHHLHKALEFFKADLEKATAGGIAVELFPAEQLAKAAENHPQVARGAIEAALVAGFQWGNTIPEMTVTAIPYLFTDLEKIKKFPGTPAAKLLEAKIASKGVTNIAWLYITRQSIFTSQKKPLIALDDFKGVKIRGLNAIADAGLSAVGASPTPISGNDVYNALQSGILDAGLTDISAAYSRRYYEIQKYGTVTPYFSVYFHMFANPAWLSKLTPAQQKAVADASRNTEAHIVGLTEATAADAVTQLRDKGMTLHMQTPEEQKAWQAAMQKPVIDAFIKSAPEDGQKLIDLMQKL
ncbi:MAG: TRAP transporter substrate-binding protein DctP [Alphaproteobacteria bacterium]|nr:TRAP transporter substrate-binding protein DctP [Alphaproteobacteria bacterium]